MIGWLDAQAGTSGDMLLGALVDAGVPIGVLQAALDPLELGLVLTAGPVTRASLGATKVDVTVGGRPAEETPGSPREVPGSAHAPGDVRRPAHTDTRTWADVRTLLGRLEDPVRSGALAVFGRLAQAEAGVHRVPVDEVHFHEVGALDALGDVVGVVAGFAHLGLEQLTCSTVSLGSGTTRGAHGPLPVPAPAVLALLAGVPVVAGASPYESTTPTGAALLAELVDGWGPLPDLVLGRTGVGAGGRDPGEVANVLRLVLGERSAQPPGGTAVLLATNVDDLDPRLWPAALTALLAAGASDAWLTPILMKKGRPAHTLSVLCPPEDAPAVRRMVFTHTSSIGLREQVVGKHALDRSESTVEVHGHAVRVKTAWLDGAPVNRNPEWEDVAAAAAATGLSPKAVLAAAVAAAQTARS